MSVSNSQILNRTFEMAFKYGGGSFRDLVCTAPALIGCPFCTVRKQSALLLKGRKILCLFFSALTHRLCEQFEAVFSPFASFPSSFSQAYKRTSISSPPSLHNHLQWVKKRRTSMCMSTSHHSHSCRHISSVFSHFLDVF